MRAEFDSDVRFAAFWLFLGQNWFLPLPYPNFFAIKKNEKQAGAELGQAQLKLGFNFTIVF